MTAQHQLMAALLVSMLGQIVLIRWAGMDERWMFSGELWLGRLGLFVMAFGDIWALSLVGGEP